MLYKYIENLSITQMKTPYAFSKYISELLIEFSKSCLFIPVNNEKCILKFWKDWKTSTAKWLYFTDSDFSQFLVFSLNIYQVPDQF